MENFISKQQALAVLQQDAAEICDLLASKVISCVEQIVPLLKKLQTQGSTAFLVKSSF